MIFILLSILFNAYIGIIFKHFGKWKINGQVAIVINYWVCVITGIIFLGANPISTTSFYAPWFSWSLLIGGLLIAMFNVMSMASVKIGVTLTQAANKMSLAIPVFFSFYLYQENVSLLKSTGILVALIGVYFITLPSTRTKENTTSNYWWLLPIMFLGSGAIDTIMKFVESSFINDNTTLNEYLIHCFGSAALLGTIYLVIQVNRKKETIGWRSLLAGIGLGIPNYFSIYFLLKALQFKDLSSSAIIPINNIGILIVVTIYGLLMFKEKLSTKNKIGISLALLSILLLISGK